MKPAAAYVTHTLIGPIPHLTVSTALGMFHAPVKLITESGKLVTSEHGTGHIRLGFPLIRDHCFVHALPGGAEALGPQIGYFDEQRFIKRRDDLIAYWLTRNEEPSDA